MCLTKSENSASSLQTVIFQKKIREATIFLIKCAVIPLALAMGI